MSAWPAFLAMRLLLKLGRWPCLLHAATDAQVRAAMVTVQPQGAVACGKSTQAALSAHAKLLCLGLRKLEMAAKSVIPWELQQVSASNAAPNAKRHGRSAISRTTWPCRGP
eukprot:CAMPEP_0197657596 /NCGR_PEP_ID=MMETSP1338-20131121/44727_1 /TAXON_ID=43686 ORGANISM="Pelagodinium beii, Strain RCC1491" /NCGR_SAMPLE_ID=MMETSP1338 /ASSEMBLY_ACC=CAM_ASM_000754 /LENGTH=110 /DNA_ID=CAMNT_0043234005 /DNA_START=661 /DNA_END=993 /DNA_ORIENTATION=+